MNERSYRGLSTWRFEAHHRRLCDQLRYTALVHAAVVPWTGPPFQSSFSSTSVQYLVFQQLVTRTYGSHGVLAHSKA